MLSGLLPGIVIPLHIVFCWYMGGPCSLERDIKRGVSRKPAKVCKCTQAISRSRVLRADRMEKFSLNLGHWRVDAECFSGLELVLLGLT